MLTDYYCAMDVGPRSNQEDCLLVGARAFQSDSLRDTGVLEGETAVLAVLDGLGGHSGGENASLYVAGRLAKRLAASRPDGPDVAAVLAEIQEETLGAGLPPDSGTTVAGILATPARVVVFNAGDSRVYRLDASGITRVSHDHSLVQRMVDSGHMTPEEAFNSPYKNIIDFGVGPGFTDRWGEFRVFVHEEPAREDVFWLLCSDGVSDVLRDAELHRALADGPAGGGPRLMEALREQRLADNTSYIAARIRP